MAIDVGDAVVKISGDTKPLDKSMSGLEGRMKGGLGKATKAAGIGLAALGTVVAGLGLASVKTFAEMGDEVQKMALRTGFATETLSELRHVAEISGTTLDSIEKSTKRLGSAIYDADQGLETYTRSFEDFGINIDEIKAMKPEDQFWTVVDALAGIEDQYKKSALAQDIFGKSGTDLLPMLDLEKGEISDLRQEAHDLGIVFDQEAADKAAKFNDNMLELKRSIDGIKVAIGEVLIDDLTEAAQKVTENVKKIKWWIDNNRELIGTFFKVSVALIGAGGLLMAFNHIITALRGIAIALAIVQGLSGPAGWAALAAGAAIAGGAIYGISKAIGEVASLGEYLPIGAVRGDYEVTGYDENGKPIWSRRTGGYQLGGLVPGPIGAPQLAVVHGGEYISPHGRGGSGTTVINIYAAGSIYSENEIVQLARKGLLMAQDRNYSTGVA